MFALKNKSSNYEVLQEIIEGKQQIAFITPQYSLEEKFDKDDFRSLLFYLGYLTIDSSYAGMAKLRVPNYVVNELYFSYFEKLLEEEYKYELDISDIQTALTILALEGDNTKLIACIEKVLSSMSSRDSIKMDEKYVKTICFTLCMLSKCYVVESEAETNKGYSDIQLLKRPGIDVNYYAKLLDSAVELLRAKHKRGEPYYWILYYSFLSPQQIRNVEEIIEKLRPHIRDISFRTYYRKRREAIEALSSVLWGYTSRDSLDILDRFFPKSK